MLILIYKAAKDKWTSTHQHGRLIRGVHCHIKRCFVCGTRFSIIPAITLDDIIIYDIVEGPVDGKHFLSFLNEHVVHHYYHDVSSHILPTHLCYRCHSPTCILVPCSILIMDNCHIHHGKEVHVLIKDMHHTSSMHCSLCTNHQQSVNLFSSLPTSPITTQSSKPSLSSRHIFNATVMTSQWLQLLTLVRTSPLTKQKVILGHQDTLYSWNRLRTVVIECLFFTTTNIEMAGKWSNRVTALHSDEILSDTEILAILS